MKTVYIKRGCGADCRGEAHMPQVPQVPWHTHWGGWSLAHFEVQSPNHALHPPAGPTIQQHTLAHRREALTAHPQMLTLRPAPLRPNSLLHPAPPRSTPLAPTRLQPGV